MDEILISLFSGHLVKQDRGRININEIYWNLNTIYPNTHFEKSHVYSVSTCENTNEICPHVEHVSN